MFERLSTEDSKPIALLKKAMLVFLALFLLDGIISSYRAYFQVRSLELDSPGLVLHSGSTICTAVVSSGRTYVDVKLELIQGAHTETLATQRVPSNEYAFFDPRAQHATQTVTLTPELLTRLQSGPAQLRATAFGHSQWMRTPPPVVRELAVSIQPQ
jgi:hypothetical protein